MKYTHMIMPLAAALMLAACSDVDEEPLSSRTREPIGFLPAMGTLSRADETTNANISSIYVTSLLSNGEAYFSSLEFDKGTDGYFVSSPEYYWPATTTANWDFTLTHPRRTRWEPT